jgi:hypothetical protein
VIPATFAVVCSRPEKFRPSLAREPRCEAVRVEDDRKSLTASWSMVWFLM